jgi:hypothetical protein
MEKEVEIKNELLYRLAHSYTRLFIDLEQVKTMDDDLLRPEIYKILEARMHAIGDEMKSILTNENILDDIKEELQHNNDLLSILDDEGFLN